MFGKLEKLVFLLLIFSIPFQKRIFLFGTDPAGGVFDEWSSGFFYFTDFLVIVLFIFWLKGLVSARRQAGDRQGLGYLRHLLFALVVLAFVSVTQADLVDVGLYRAIKLTEFVFLLFYTSSYVGRWTSHIRAIMWVFIVSGVFQSLIAILQFAKQSSLGLEIFHESTLGIHLKGVAHILSSDGSFLIRVYGTFPSPNVLAGFLGLCLLFLFYLLLERHCLGKLVVFVYAISTFLLSFAFILTFSRGTVAFFIIVAGLFFAGIFLLKRFKEYRKQAKILLLLVTGCWLLITVLAWPEISSRFLGSSIDEPALQERFYFNKVGINVVQQDIGSAIFGIGAGNFVHNFRQAEPDLPEQLYQPVHNVFILVASELGALGFFSFVIFIALLAERLLQKFIEPHQNKDIQIKRYSRVFVYLWSSIAILCFFLLISMYDHYFLTLQQGGLMFWIALGLIVGVLERYNNLHAKVYW